MASKKLKKTEMNCKICDVQFAGLCFISSFICVILYTYAFDTRMTDYKICCDDSYD